jgi:hypothetical protein
MFYGILYPDRGQSGMNNQLALKGAFNCPKTFAGYLMHGLLLLIRIYL